MKPKKRSTVAAGLPVNGRIKDEHVVVDIGHLQVGDNKNVTLVLKVITFIPNPTGLPVIFVGMDGEENFITVSVYNIDEELLDFETEVFIPNPKVKVIKLEREGQVVMEYKAVVVETPTSIKLNGEPVKLRNIKRGITTTSQH